MKPETTKPITADDIPDWVDCNNCANIDTVSCRLCKGRIPSSLYINYAPLEIFRLK